jgi:hypothetical protein
MNRLLMHLANFGGINNFASLPYKTFTIVMFYCGVVNDNYFRSIINICFYDNFSTPLSIKALGLLF